ncbi:hypothetical protein [Bacillus pumilus]|uniref:hypothetical protein n=1 Tax=Bacillus pumilus TaxID=1408 RepID=UPI0011A3D633|nr:hypothetical protein [Bacillus pumilus]
MTFPKAMLTAFKGFMMLIATIASVALIFFILVFFGYMIPKFFWSLNIWSFWIYVFSCLFLLCSFAIWVESRLQEDEEYERPHSL